jgi:hypothetical protein
MTAIRVEVEMSSVPYYPGFQKARMLFGENIRSPHKLFSKHVFSKYIR